MLVVNSLVVKSFFASKEEHFVVVAPVQQLCRFVRLPIPGCTELNLLNARYSDFEGQGVQMLRVPFWKGPAAGLADPRCHDMP